MLPLLHCGGDDDAIGVETGELLEVAIPARGSRELVAKLEQELAVIVTIDCGVSMNPEGRALREPDGRARLVLTQLGFGVPEEQCVRRARLVSWPAAS
jgi:hypothetical protein